MNINLTLIGQMLTFLVFIWFTMKYVWPPVTKAIYDREQKIADGLAAGERGQRDLELAHSKSSQILQEAKAEAARILELSAQRGARLVDEAKQQAQVERQHLLAHAEQEILQQKNQAKRDLQNYTAGLALSLAEKIVQRDIDENVHRQWLDKALAESQL